MTGVTTSAALCTLTVSQSVWNADLLLQLIVKLAGPLQVTLKLEKKKGNSLKLSFADDTVQLTQRNAILRGICGFLLHYALDQAPFYLMGGHSVTCRASGQSAVAVGAMVSWMSLAQECSNPAEILADLESHLTNHSFLAPSHLPTIADMDLALKLAKQDVTDYPNVTRWLSTTTAVMHDYASQVGLEMMIPVVAARPSPLPVFFYGNENVDAILKPAPKAQQQPQKSNKPQEKKDVAKQQKQPAKQEKAEKKQAKQGKQPKGGGGAGNQPPAEVNISALDIRVGKITKVWPHEEADKLFCEEIDLGTEKRQIASGLRPFYQTEDLQDRHVLVLCNLKKRNLVGFPSHGMVLCASNADHTAVEFVVPPEGSQIGERVVFEGFEGEPEPESKMNKKKIFEKLAPDLKTDESGQVVWKGVIAKTSSGVVKALNGMANGSVS